MSSAWTIGFTATGEQKELDRLEVALPRGEEEINGGSHFYFDYAEVKEHGTGYIKVRAARNYGGPAGIENMVEDFPKLAFFGSYWGEQQALEGRQDFAACGGVIVAKDLYSYTLDKDDPDKLIVTTRESYWRIDGDDQ